ncbi:bifunctional riboflavin kinase/FAD synthetase [Catenovulum maritimum]|uniref:Riboflavin biosynthesis protein n=1 Tax=Catenovulum maritimum TaxID=1513271 RepID=A0A0J8JK86_9ALTE|nr:bifunctional riboflavin kinase/FAD synthetase [Catenovulum maritimum]KMT64881.1 FMN adenylyltransferase [Catenovulum maritimum]
MQLIRGIHNIKPEHSGCVLTIGNFDGVHKGHLSVLAQLKKKAEQLALPAVVMTFEPQPVEVLAPEFAPARLSRWRDKYQLLSNHVERMLCVRFNPEFAQLTADQFIGELLVEKLGIKHIVVGDDFRFGKGRIGDFEKLKQAGKVFGFTVEDTQTCELEGKRVSSTEIRKAIAGNNFELAEQLLGREFSVSGTVVHGEKRGRTIGFPTANVLLHRKVSPVSGVYAVQIQFQDQVFNGVANVGSRPTVNGQRQQLEVHIFNFTGDLYQQRVNVLFKSKIRSEHKFASFDALKNQIKLDVIAAQDVLNCAQ